MFAHHLAPYLGWRSVREMMDGMDAKEFNDWIAYWKIVGGWGPEVNNWIFACIAANTYTGKSRHWRKPASYLPYFVPPPKHKMNDDEIRESLTTFLKGDS